MAAEVESISKAYEDLSEQNGRLLQQLDEKDRLNNNLLTERLKNQHNISLLKVFLPFNTEYFLVFFEISQKDFYICLRGGRCLTAPSLFSPPLHWIGLDWIPPHCIGALDSTFWDPKITSCVPSTRREIPCGFFLHFLTLCFWSMGSGQKIDQNFKKENVSLKISRKKPPQKNSDFTKIKHTNAKLPTENTHTHTHSQHHAVFHRFGPFFPSAAMCQKCC